VGASRGLRPGALAGDCSPGDRVAGEAVLGFRKGLFEVDDNGSVRPGEGRRTVYEQTQMRSAFSVSLFSTSSLSRFIWVCARPAGCCVYFLCVKQATDVGTGTRQETIAAQSMEGE
jgi:hypothetical protein